MSETINQGSYELPKHSQNCIQRRSQIAFLFWDKYCCQYIFISILYFPLIFSLDFECGIWVVVALFSATLIDLLVLLFRSEQVLAKAVFPFCEMRGDTRSGAWIQVWRLSAWLLRRRSKMRWRRWGELYLLYFSFFFLCLNHWRTFDTSNASNHKALCFKFRD
mgnify:CR=1 FL=1